MLVALFNAVKVESVPLKINKSGQRSAVPREGGV
jgi:hypothetical protein